MIKIRNQKKAIQLIIANNPIINNIENPETKAKFILAFGESKLPQQQKAAVGSKMLSIMIKVKNRISEQKLKQEAIKTIMLNGIAYKIDLIENKSSIDSNKSTVKKEELKVSGSLPNIDIKNCKLAKGATGSLFNNIDSKIFLNKNTLNNLIPNDKSFGVVPITKGNWDEVSEKQISSTGKSSNKSFKKTLNLRVVHFSKTKNKNILKPVLKSWLQNMNIDQKDPKEIKNKKIVSSMKKLVRTSSEIAKKSWKNSINFLNKKSIFHITKNSINKDFGLQTGEKLNYQIKDKKSNNKLIPQTNALIKVGRSHPILMPISNEIKTNLVSPIKLELTSLNKQILNTQAGRFVNISKRDVYKGKGIYVLENGKKFVLKTQSKKTK